MRTTKVTITQALLSVLMLIAGIGIPIMAALNAGLGSRIGHPFAAVVILCAVAFLIGVVLLAFMGLPDLSNIKTIPPFYFIAGSLFVLYIASITFSAPKIGLANAVFFVLLGQLISAAIIDHFGLWDSIQSPITPKRIIGILVMAVGVYLARKDVTSSLPPHM